MLMSMQNTAVFILLTFLFSCSTLNNATKIKLKGMYSYMADIAFFTDCNTNKKYKIAFEKDNKNLERAYLAVAESPGEEIIVTLFGHFENRTKIYEEGEREYLIVDKFDKIWPNIDCNRNLGVAKLKNTFWNLRELNKKTSNKFRTAKDIHFIINQDNSIKGFSGCNNFLGDVKIKNDSLKFGHLGSTQMACKNLKIENEFLGVLSQANRFNIYGEYLYLYNNKKLLAKFESTYFN